VRLLFIELFGAASFVGTAGYLFREQFEKNVFFSSIVCLLLFASTWLTLEEIAKRFGFMHEYQQGQVNQATNTPSTERPQPSAPTPVSADNDAWGRAVISGSIEAFTQYLNQFPNGAHAKEAHTRIDTLRKASDDIAWSQATSANTIEAFTQYLNQFPSGVHAGEAQQRINGKRDADNNAWARALNENTTQAFAQYLNQFPTGAHAGEAQQRVSIRAADNGVWSQATSANTIEAFTQYLNQFPSGVHAGDARQRIANMQQQERQRRQHLENIRCDTFTDVGRFCCPIGQKAINGFDQRSGRWVPFCREVGPFE
jgi:hypothetical protein